MTRDSVFAACLLAIGVSAMIRAAWQFMLTAWHRHQYQLQEVENDPGTILTKSGSTCGVCSFPVVTLQSAEWDCPMCSSCWISFGCPDREPNWDSVLRLTADRENAPDYDRP